MVRFLLVAFALLVASTNAGAQQSRCADCHLANPDSPGHRSEWETSPHGRQGVGCDRCHGGNADTFERLAAHRGILAAGNPASPIARGNLPETCGKCHVGPYVEFQKSRHLALLKRGDARVPTCTTCHESVGAHVMSPKALERECAGCHKPDGPETQRGFPAQGRLMVEGITAVRADLDNARALIARVKDRERRAALDDAYAQAEVPLVEAAEAGHAFVFTGLQDRLKVARSRTDALLDQLANVRPPTR